MRLVSRALSTRSRVVLRARPAPNSPVTPAHFEVLPAAEHAFGPNEVRCHTLVLSVDPFLRCRFNAQTGVDYTKPYVVGEPICSAGLGVVLEAGADVESSYAPGTLVVDPFDSWRALSNI